MSEGAWSFANAPLTRKLFDRYKMPKREVQLSFDQLEAVAEGLCVVLWTGQEIVFVSRAEETDELHRPD